MTIIIVNETVRLIHVGKWMLKPGVETEVDDEVLSNEQVRTLVEENHLRVVTVN